METLRELKPWHQVATPQTNIKTISILEDTRYYLLPDRNGDKRAKQNATSTTGIHLILSELELTSSELRDFTVTKHCLPQIFGYMILEEWSSKIINFSLKILSFFGEGRGLFIDKVQIQSWKNIFFAKVLVEFEFKFKKNLSHILN